MTTFATMLDGRPALICTLYSVQISADGSPWEVLYTTPSREAAEAKYDELHRWLAPHSTLRLMAVGQAGGQILRDSRRDALPTERTYQYEEDGDIAYHSR